jgi:formamidopyrimidine-DNA glycosylase
MPELAEIETLKNYLKQNIIGEKIVKYIQLRNNLRYELSNNLEIDVNNAVILDVRRRAKFINIILDNSNILTYHLGMSGRLTVKEKSYTAQKHDHVIISFDTGKKLVFNDARRFGMIYSCHITKIEQQHYLKKMGQEPLAKEFDATFLKEKLSRKKSAIKLAIMDNEIVVGVGNIYAAESLFMAGINPFKPACMLTHSEAEKLVQCIKTVLEKAIEAGGTTLRDFVSGDNSPGYFKQKLSVYDRKGLPCYICDDKIEKTKQAGRSTFFCKTCQKD